MILRALSTLILFTSAIGIAYAFVAMAAVSRFARRKPARRFAGAAVTVLKPLHGAEPGLFERLAAVCRQDYAEPVQIVCGVQDAADPAVAVVRALQSAFPEREIALTVEPCRRGSNRKVSNLIAMLARARHDVIVLADSDMEVGPTWLRDVVAALEAPGVGAVTCAYHGSPGGGLWAALSALGIDAHFLPNVVVGLSFGLASPCFGSTIALRRTTLEAVGGFEAFSEMLADDYAIGAAVRARGLRVVVPPFSIGHACQERSARELVLHELRWARTIKAMNGPGYAGMAVTNPLPLALLGAAAGNRAGLVFAVAALLARIALCRSVERAFALRRHAAWLIPVRDLFSFVVFVSSFFGRDVSWRGHRYRLALDGTLGKAHLKETDDANLVSSGPLV